MVVEIDAYYLRFTTSFVSLIQFHVAAAEILETIGGRARSRRISRQLRASGETAVHNSTARLPPERGPNEVLRGDRPAAGIHDVDSKLSTPTDLHQRNGEGAHERLGEERRLIAQVEPVDAGFEPATEIEHRPGRGYVSGVRKAGAR